MPHKTAVAWAQFSRTQSTWPNSLFHRETLGADSHFRESGVGNDPKQIKIAETFVSSPDIGYGQTVTSRKTLKIRLCYRAGWHYRPAENGDS